MWAHRLSNMNYQNLIDRNWRRSGKYCYKPVLERTCCPMYTIRCDAVNFKLRKSHKKVKDVMDDRPQVKPLFNEKESQNEYKGSAEPNKESVEKIIDNDINTSVNVMSCDHKSDDKVMERRKGKAKNIRKERKLRKIMAKEKCDEKRGLEIMSENFKSKAIAKNKCKSLEDYLNEIETSLNAKHKLKIRFVSTTTEEYKQTFEESHEVYRKYQMSIHGDSLDKCSSKQYKRFLIDSPLENERCVTSDGLPDHLGSFHQQYWLDNKLIAVGVIDVLPYCVSSVYLYYDPEYDFLSLGTYSALRELQLVRRLQQYLPDLKYYYMGFYIHSCPKMRYKGRFSPSDLLCGETFSWHPITKCVPKLDLTKYSRFEDNPNAMDSDSKSLTDAEIKILYNSTDMSLLVYKTVRAIDRNEEKQIKEYAKLIGRKSTLKILVCGDVRGKYRQLFSRISVVNKKSGPFDVVLCVGQFFGVDCDEEYNDLIHGSICLPSIPIYILGATDERLVKYYKTDDPNSDYESGFELIDGITYLGRKGILTGSSGLRIAYFSGNQSTDGKSGDKSTFDMKDYESLLLSHQSSSSVVDLLLTSQWPKHVFRYTEGHEKSLEDKNSEFGSELVSKLSLLLRPRYHLVSGYNSFYERHPFRNHRVLAETARHVTRFIAVADVANEAKQKWLYAFAITPAKGIDANELIKQPTDVTENPFFDIKFEAKNEMSTKDKSNESTQFFYDLSQRHDNQNRSYNNKRKRQQNNEFRERKQRPPMNPQECWFCLASPQVEKHLIISIGDHSYLAMAKGGLTDEHLLILPIDHLRSTIELESEEVANELNRFKSALIKYFDSKSQSVVFFERNFKSSHLQIQCVSIPKSKAQDLKSVVLEQTEQRNVDFKQLSDDLELKDVLNPGIPYFYMELPNGKVFTRIKTNEFFPIQLGRELLAHPSVLNCGDRVDWKQCSLPDDEAIAIANRIREEFKHFDFTLQ
ncbi:unnamed protein product [Oppiella nova]|uniref:arginyltransferase n=1 Tax=Oppiella nova TaxID=334625 RepID=A0A7R9QFM8_9ACAR|nr:unnamed protein product [Oppiella nova]CAG2164796.1 unnamed protein product [Oppiella nova]